MKITKVSNPAAQAESEYQAARTVQAVADIEYIAMMTGVDIFEDETMLDNSISEMGVTNE